MSNKNIWAATWQNIQNECAPSEDSDQPGHPPSLIRVFADRMKKPGSLAVHWTHSEDSDRTGQIIRLIWVFVGRTLILWVLSCRGSFMQFERLSKLLHCKYNCTYTYTYHEIVMSRAMRKCVLCNMRTTKAQISMRIRAVWLAPLLFAVWIV